MLIGNQSRPKIFDLAIKRPEVLYSKVVEIDERVTLCGYTSDPKRRDREVQFDDKGGVARPYQTASETESTGELVQGISGEAVRVLRRPDKEAIRKALQALYDESVNAYAMRRELTLE